MLSAGKKWKWKLTDLLTIGGRDGSNTALVATCTMVSEDFFFLLPIMEQKGIDANKKKKRTGRRATFLTDSSQKKQKSLGTINVIKRQFMQWLHVEWSGITLTCSDWWASIVVGLQISVWGRKETGRMILCCVGGMLCWATKQKVSDSLFPIQSGGRAQTGGTTSQTQGLLIAWFSFWRWWW